MTLPAVIITGASGFVGRHLLEELKNDYRIFAIARRSQRECGAPIHPNIAWMQVDIGDREGLERTFREIRTAGGAKFLFHFAAYYNFEGSKREEYERTNVEGTRNVLEFVKDLGLSRLFFSSSVAACAFPEKGSALTESSPADGDHIYAWSKRLGEEMVARFSEIAPTCIVRFGAVYSDWCEYPPLYMFLNTWLGKSWKARILAGKGESAIPYIHIRDIIRFLQQLLQHDSLLERSEVLIASTTGCTSHRQLFQDATRSYYGKQKDPVTISALLAGWGLIMMNVWGKLRGRPPFERPWMRHYIDLQLTIDNSLTCSRLKWIPDPRFRIERRLPFLIERMKSDPVEWHSRNLSLIRRVAFRPELLIYQHLSGTEEAVVDLTVETVRSLSSRESFPHLGSMEGSELRWFVRLIYRLILTSIQSGNRLLLLNYLEVTRQSHFEGGLTATEICHLLQHLQDSAEKRLKEVDELKDCGQQVFDCVTMPIELAKDEIIAEYRLFERGESPISDRTGPEREPTRQPRDLLEETIWQCLVQRK